jgi:hypothetical protein
LHYVFGPQVFDLGLAEVCGSPVISEARFGKNLSRFAAHATKNSGRVFANCDSTLLLPNAIFYKVCGLTAGKLSEAKSGQGLIKPLMVAYSSWHAQRTERLFREFYLHHAPRTWL